MANNAAGGAGALLSGLAGGYMGGMQLQNMMANQQKPADPNHQSTGTAVQAAANQPGALGLPAGNQVTSLGLPAGQQPAALPRGRGGHRLGQGRSRAHVRPREGSSPSGLRNSTTAIRR